MSTPNILVPRCLFIREHHDQHICLNPEGYFTPCCWFDAEDARTEDPRIAGFFDPSLNIENYDDPKDIIEGEYWQKFFELLIKTPDLAPRRCWHFCAADGPLITNKYIGKNIRIQV